MAVTTIIEDTADYTITRIVGDAPGNVTTQLVYKAGSSGFNIEAMQTKMRAALAALETADANWATLTPAQKDNAAHLSTRVTAKLIRFALGQFEAN
jgi:hypothetical protein